MNIFKRVYFRLYVIVKYGFHWRKPMFLLRLVRNLVRAKFWRLLGIKKFNLRGADFAITYACNFRCSHCYAENLKSPIPRRVMTIDDYRRVCREMERLGAVVFSLQGGEPFIRKDIFDIIEAFRPRRNHIIITTNGSLLDEPTIEKLASTGIDTLYFSVDSGIAEEHDRFRNHPGSYAKIMEDIELCRKHKIKIVINTTVHKDNLYSEGLKKILDYSHRNRIMLETIYARPLGYWTGNPEVMLSQEDRDYYYRLRKNYPFVVRDLDNNYGGWGCPALKEVLYFTPYGDVCGCPFMHIVFGNIFKEPLEKIRNRALKLNWFNQYGGECLTAVNRDFMRHYYPLVKGKSFVPFSEFIETQGK